jgi:plastocyanin
MLEDLWHSIIEFTSKLVVPDWGSLVALIPLGVAALVVVYLVWNGARLATAPPTRRGVRPIKPLPPAGVHVPGGSFAPIFAALGSFLLLFGLIAGGPALWLGAIALVLTLLYWGREALTDYDHIPDVAEEGGTRPRLPDVVHAGPPPGVHLPGPSFRPILGALGSTLLLFGIVAGGPLLFAGIIVLVITLIGWLVDAGKEFRATEQADITGHIENGPAPRWPRSTLVAIVAIVAVAAVLASGILPIGAGAPAASGSPGASAPPPGSQAPPGGGGGGSAPPPNVQADVVITAEGIKWTTTSVQAPAGKAFSLALDNRDQGAPHDIQISDSSGKQVYKTEVVTGPKAQVFQAPALQAGSYPFKCTIHPNMTGTITAG